MISLPISGSEIPKREKGLSVHMLPKEVAELSGGELKWGFTVRSSVQIKMEGAEQTFQSAHALISFFEKQSTSVQENGIWLVVTHPDAYSKEEQEILEQLKKEAKKKDFQLFICRGSELPNGWVRYGS